MMTTAILRNADELLNSALANIGLFAHTIWANDQQDRYRTSNRSLWKKICEIDSDLKKWRLSNAKPSSNKFAQEVIPESRLAQYCPTAKYDNQREKFYAEINNESYSLEKNEFDSRCPWTFQEVEEYMSNVARRRALANGDDLITNRHVNNKSNIHRTNEKNSMLDRERNIPPWYMVTNVLEAQLERRIFCDNIYELWKVPIQQLLEQQQYRKYSFTQNPKSILIKDSDSNLNGNDNKISNQKNDEIQKIHSNFQNQRMKMSAKNQNGHFLSNNSHDMSHCSLPLLCADVPEFFPEGTGHWMLDQEHQPPSIIGSNQDTFYQDDSYLCNGHPASRKMFNVYQGSMPIVTPIGNTTIWPIHPWAQRMPPPPGQISYPAYHQLISPSICAPTQNPIVMPRPMKFPDTTNLKIPGNIRPPSPISMYPKSAQEYQPRRKTQGVDFNNLILLTKSATKVKRNPVKITKSKPSTPFLPDYESVQPFARSKWNSTRREREMITVDISSPPKAHSSPKKAGDSSDIFLDSTSTVSDDRSSCSLSCEVGESFEKVYDELEHQALEQYRTSEESLILRYQELENQALEQYKNNENLKNVQELFYNEEPLPNFKDLNPSQYSIYENSVLKRSSSSLDVIALSDQSGLEQTSVHQHTLHPFHLQILKPQYAPIMQRSTSIGNFQAMEVVPRFTTNHVNSQRNLKNGITNKMNDKNVKTPTIRTLKRRLLQCTPDEHVETETTTDSRL